MGVKRSVLADGRGVPLAVAIEGANVHDQKLVDETFKSSFAVKRPERSERVEQHLCADKGYDTKAVRKSATRRGYMTHIPRKGEDPQRPTRKKGRARRWVVERTHSWINKARRLLIRWEKKSANYLAFMHLQFALTAWRAAGVFG